MKSTGMVRKVDELGRIVLPIEMRRTLGISIKDPVEFFVDGDKIVMKKYEADNTCMVTGEIDQNNISLFDGKIKLSKEGANKLIEELQKNVHNFK